MTSHARPALDAIGVGEVVNVDAHWLAFGLVFPAYKRGLENLTVVVDHDTGVLL